MVHVIEPRRMLTGSAVQRYLSADVIESVRRKDIALGRALEQGLERFCQRSGVPRPNREHAGAPRIPGGTILEQAGSVDADCIVLGSHRYSALSRMVIGSVAREVTMKAWRPVFLFPM